MAMSHKHVYRMVMHLDGCHTYTSAYSCECGASASTTGERVGVSMMQDPECERCRELMSGADGQWILQKHAASGKCTKREVETIPGEKPGENSWVSEDSSWKEGQ